MNQTISKEILEELIKQEQDEIKLHQFKIQEYQKRLQDLLQNMQEHRGALKGYLELLSKFGEEKKEDEKE